MRRQWFHQFIAWVVLHPDGFVTSTVIIPKVHDSRRAAIRAARTMARYRIELRDNVDMWDDPTWKQAYRQGWRVRPATVTVPPPKRNQ